MDAERVMAGLALLAGPVRLDTLRRLLEAHPDVTVDGMATTAGVPGLDADEIVLLSLTYQPGDYRGAMTCQRVGREAYMVDGVSVVPVRERPGREAGMPVWSCQNYRVVAHADPSGVPHYGVEERDRLTGAWGRAAEWETRLHPDTIGGVVDCLLWLRQKGKL